MVLARLLTYDSNTNWREKLESLCFPSLDQVRNMHNYPRLFLNPIHYRKITFLYFKRIQKVLTKPCLIFGCSWIKSTWWRWRSKSQKSHKQKVLCSMTRTLILAHFQWEEKRVKAMTIYLSRWWKTKPMETLTLEGIYKVPKWV